MVSFATVTIELLVNDPFASATRSHPKSPFSAISMRAPKRSEKVLT